MASDFRACYRPDMTRRKFVILARGRSGTSLLCELLDSHPDISCHKEIFSLEALYFKKCGVTSNNQWFRDPTHSLQQFWNTFGKTHICCGFKVFPGQVARSFYDQILEDPEISKIILRRENVVRRYLSQENARKYRVYDISPTYLWLMLHRELYLIWDCIREFEFFGQLQKSFVRFFRLIKNSHFFFRGYDPKPIKLRPDELLKDYEEADTFYTELNNRLEATGQTAFYLTYNELCGDQQEEVLGRLLHFLSLPPAKLHSKMKKMHPGELSELIENFSELQQALADTPLEPMLDAAG